MNEQKTIKAGIKQLGEKPCSVCGNKAEAVASMTPDDPAAFGAGPGDALYFAICKKCLGWFDPAFMEAHLKHCGIQIRPELKDKADANRSIQ